VKDAAARGADEAQRYARDTANTVKDAAVRGADEAQSYVRETANTMKEASAYGAGSDSLRGSSPEQTRGQSGSQPGPSSTGGTRRS
jgi:hypothetical protein